MDVPSDLAFTPDLTLPPNLTLTPNQTPSFDRKEIERKLGKVTAAQQEQEAVAKVNYT